jgi:hypothetical protein
VKTACLGEIAFHENWIGEAQAEALAATMYDNTCGRYVTTKLRWFHTGALRTQKADA